MKAILGLCCGAIIGGTAAGFVQFFFGESDLLVYIGLIVGAAFGAFFSMTMGKKEIRGIALFIVVGILGGMLLGTLAGLRYGEEKTMEIQPNDGIIQGHFSNFGIAFGVPIGGGFGGLLGIIFYLLKHKK